MEYDANTIHNLNIKKNYDKLHQNTKHHDTEFIKYNNNV